MSKTIEYKNVNLNGTTGLIVGKGGEAFIDTEDYNVFSATLYPVSGSLSSCEVRVGVSFTKYDTSAASRDLANLSLTSGTKSGAAYIYGPYLCVELATAAGSACTGNIIVHLRHVGSRSEEL